MKLQSVEEFFYKRETVEKYNDDKIIKLNWECPDVLFSINEQIQNIAQKKDTLCRRMYN